jgi:hypothetical protein
MADYEVRLYRAGGALSIISPIVANSVSEAEMAARALLKGNIERAEIWRDETRLLTLSRFHTKL